MLIKCPECGKENISDQAPQCPSCGCPIKTISAERTITVERTKKKWKRHQLISALLIIIGFIFLFPGIFVVAIPLLVAGVILTINTRINIWWHHD